MDVTSVTSVKLMKNYIPFFKEIVVYMWALTAAIALCCSEGQTCSKTELSFEFQISFGYLHTTTTFLWQEVPSVHLLWIFSSRLSFFRSFQAINPLLLSKHTTTSRVLFLPLATRALHVSSPVKERSVFLTDVSYNSWVLLPDQELTHWERFPYPEQRQGQLNSWRLLFRGHNWEKTIIQKGSAYSNSVA